MRHELQPVQFPGVVAVKPPRLLLRVVLAAAGGGSRVVASLTLLD